MLDIVNILNQIDNFMYFPILIIVMALSGLYFTTRTKGVQIRLFPESVRLILEPSGDENAVSSLQAMLVSTASRLEQETSSGFLPRFALEDQEPVSGCGSCVS